MLAPTQWATAWWQALHLMLFSAIHPNNWPVILLCCQLLSSLLLPERVTKHKNVGCFYSTRHCCVFYLAAEESLHCANHKTCTPEITFDWPAGQNMQGLIILIWQIRMYVTNSADATGTKTKKTSALWLLQYLKPQYRCNVGQSCSPTITSV